MDYIKKTICLEGARSRTQGLMPYYEIGAAYPDVSGGSCYTMEELGLSAPQIIYIMNELQRNGLDVPTDVLTVEEAAGEILMRYKKG